MKTIRYTPPVPNFLWGILGLLIWAASPGMGMLSGQESVEIGSRSGIRYGGQYFGFDPDRIRRGDHEASLRTDEAFDSDSNGTLLSGEPDESTDDQYSEYCGGDQSCRGLGLWARGEFLWWQAKGMNLPALATTSPNSGILPQATVLFGGNTVNDDMLPGGRFTLGLWLDDCDCQGIEASFLMLGRASQGFNGSSANFTELARPFTNVDPANLGADARLIVSPNTATGSLAILATSQFYSFDLLYRRNLIRSDCCTTDVLIGFRHAELIDQVRIDENTTSQATPIAGTNFVLFDQFRTRNEFNGAEFGVFCQRRLNDCWTWDFTAKGAIGQVQSSIGIAGQTRTNPAGGTSTFASGGLLAQSTNIGNFSQTDFTAMGDFNLSLRRKLRCGWSANVGYSLIAWGDVLRAGEQIDTNVNTSQIPPGTLTGDPRPLVPFASTNFWAHGLQLGVERAF